MRGLGREFVAVALGAAAICTPPARAGEPLRLEPSSKWALNYAADSCLMMRSFGEESRKILLSLERFGPGDGFQLLIAGRPLTRVAGASGAAMKLKIRFGPGEVDQKVTMWPATFLKMPAVLDSNALLGVRPSKEPDTAVRSVGKGTQDAASALLQALEPIDPAREAAVTYLQIERAAGKVIILDLGPMDKPMAAMRACTDELVTHWGLDLARHTKLTKGLVPASSPQTWISDTDYPMRMILTGQQGLVQFRLMVSEDGKPTSCHIQRSTRPQEFDDAVCRSLMKRARFTPALDADGKPMPSYFRSSVRFEMAS